jgi:hypothetical protein
VKIITIPNERNEKTICLIFLIFVEKRTALVNNVYSCKVYNILVLYPYIYILKIIS